MLIKMLELTNCCSTDYNADVDLTQMIVRGYRAIG